MFKKNCRLGVNIDHVATLRQARGEGFPSVVEAANEVIRAGADGIVCHLREDRRHIQDADVFALRQLPVRLDLEMAATDEMVKIALKVKPDMVTLVPEKRKELTTEGGLAVKKYFSSLFPKIQKLEKAGIKVSLFIEPSPSAVACAAKTGASLIEIHTGKYANAKKKVSELKKIAAAARLAAQLNLRVNAGHGLDYNNVCAIAQLPEVEELNIGFSIIARAVFVGLKQAVREMVTLAHGFGASSASERPPAGRAGNGVYGRASIARRGKK
jgi:pyridoxine 5-phosphate synthase